MSVPVHRRDASLKVFVFEKVLKTILIFAIVAVTAGSRIARL